MKAPYKKNTMSTRELERFWNALTERRRVKLVLLKDGPFKGRKFYFAMDLPAPVNAWSRAGTWIGEYSSKGVFTGELVPHPAAKEKVKAKRKREKKSDSKSIIVESKG